MDDTTTDPLRGFQELMEAQSDETVAFFVGFHRGAISALETVVRGGSADAALVAHRDLLEIVARIHAQRRAAFEAGPAETHWSSRDEH
ncbi:MAG TPA: hypothetical protein DEH78_05225 [Solibacterales bacterium]|nr:hypothetical protein [Bryobacterales bacterium]